MPLASMNPIPVAAKANGFAVAESIPCDHTSMKSLVATADVATGAF